MHQTSDASLNDAVIAVNRMFGYTAAHPGNVIYNLAERGNTASTTHFVALSDHIRGNRIKSGDNVVFGISGSGATVGAALYTFDDLPDRLRRAPDASTAPGARSAPAPAAIHQRCPVSRSRASVSPPRSSPARHVRSASRCKPPTACLDNSGVDQAALDLIIHAGIYRDDFICEPAIAALVAGELGINDDIESPDDPKTFRLRRAQRRRRIPQRVPCRRPHDRRRKGRTRDGHGLRSREQHPGRRPPALRPQRNGVGV